MLTAMHWQHGPLPLPDVTDTDALAQRIAPHLRAGDLLSLRGPVGAGKSHFARAILRALGVDEDIPSPTFTLVQTYETPAFDIWHCDLYRMGDDPQELIELGLEEAANDALLLVEWPNALPRSLREAALVVDLAANEAGHVVTLSCDAGDWPERLEPALG